MAEDLAGIRAEQPLFASQLQNRITEARERTREERTSEPTPSGDPAGGESLEAQRPRHRGVPARVPPISPLIAAKYLVAENRYHFQDRTLAFTDKGSHLTVETTNSQVLKDLIEIAKSRDWKRIAVSGTNEFRRAAWREAYLQGLSVSGYAPPDLERKAADRDRDRARRDMSEAHSSENPVAPDPTVAAAPAREGLASPESTREQAVLQAIRSAATTGERLQLKFPDLNRAVFRQLDSHQRFADAYVKAGLIREVDREGVIAMMRESLAARLEARQAVRDLDTRRVQELIDRSVEQASLKRAPSRGRDSPAQVR